MTKTDNYKKLFNYIKRPSVKKTYNTHIVNCYCNDKTAMSQSDKCSSCVKLQQNIINYYCQKPTTLPPSNNYNILIELQQTIEQLTQANNIIITQYNELYESIRVNCPVVVEDLNINVQTDVLSTTDMTIII